MTKCHMHAHTHHIAHMDGLFVLLYRLTLREALVEGDNAVTDLGLEVLADLALLVDLGENLGFVGAEVGEEVSLPGEDLLDRDVVEETVDTSEDEWNHLVDGHGLVLLLLEKLGETETTVEGLLGGGVEIRTELGEGSDFTVLGQEELEGTSDLLHGLELSSGTDTGDGKTDVNGWADTLVEKFGLQEDLAVSDGNDVGWDISGHITTLGLDDRKGSERATLVGVVQLGSTLEKTRVEVEDAIFKLVVEHLYISKEFKELTYSPG